MKVATLFPALAFVAGLVAARAGLAGGPVADLKPAALSKGPPSH